MLESLKTPKNRPFRTHGGAPVPHRKNTMESPTVFLPCPSQVILPMQQHVGAPCTPVVKVGDTVTVGQLIADSDKFVSAPIHATVSGTVSKLTKVALPSGQKVDAIVIDSDGKMTPCPDLHPPKADTREEFLAAVRASGLVGLGGAGFPAHVKLNVAPDKHIDTLIINGAECEPYITTDYREAMENSWDIFAGVYAIKDLLGVERVIIVIESNKPQAIAELTRIAENETHDANDQVKVLSLPSHYPQGAEKVLVQACTGRRIGKGKLPADVGCVVMNITSVSFLARYLKTGMPLVTKRLTVDGSAIAEPKNIIAPIGTPMKELIAFCGGYRTTPKKILMGGPMMGFALTDDSVPLMKQNNALLAFDEKDATLPESTACIRCGRCVAACPMHLMPTLMEQNVKAKNTDALESLSLMSCMECGSCAFVCPAKRQLVQAFRTGKALLRAASPKK